MANAHLCPKCGAGLAPGFSHCRLCGRKIDADVVAALAARPAPAVAAAPPGAVRLAAAGAGSSVLTIWLDPRQTIRDIVSDNPRRGVLAIALLVGTFGAIDRLAGRNAGDLLALEWLLLISVAAGSLGGVVGLYVSAALVRWTGRLIGGTATSEEIRAAAAWGSVPALAGSLLWVPVIAVAGHDVFTSKMAGVTGPVAIFLLLVWIVQVAAAIWSFFTGLQCLGEVQGFSAWKALGNYALAGLVILAPLALLIALAVALPILLR